MKKILLSFLFLAAWAACSTGGRPADSASPAWVHEPTRTVENGYIVYVGTGEDSSAERARFKAESTAVQDIANECSFAPKGTRVEDHYDSVYLGAHQAFAKIAVSFEDCEAAKAALEPEKIKALANVTLTEQLKHYQELVYDPPEEDGSGVNPALAATDAPAPATGMIRDEGHFLVVRQQVAYFKETVILAPPSDYPPASPQARTLASRLQPASRMVHDFEVANPQVHRWANSWSAYERRPGAPLPATILRPKRSAVNGKVRGYSRKEFADTRPPGEARGPSRKGKRRKKKNPSDWAPGN